MSLMHVGVLGIVGNGHHAMPCHYVCEQVWIREFLFFFWGASIRDLEVADGRVNIYVEWEIRWEIEKFWLCNNST